MKRRVDSKQHPGSSEERLGASATDPVEQPEEQEEYKFEVHQSLLDRLGANR